MGPHPVPGLAARFSAIYKGSPHFKAFEWFDVFKDPSPLAGTPGQVKNVALGHFNNHGRGSLLVHVASPYRPWCTLHVDIRDRSSTQIRNVVALYNALVDTQVGKPGLRSTSATILGTDVHDTFHTSATEKHDERCGGRRAWPCVRQGVGVGAHSIQVPLSAMALKRNPWCRFANAKGNVGFCTSDAQASHGQTTCVWLANVGLSIDSAHFICVRRPWLKGGRRRGMGSGDERPSNGQVWPRYIGAVGGRWDAQNNAEMGRGARVRGHVRPGNGHTKTV